MRDFFATRPARSIFFFRMRVWEYRRRQLAATRFSATCVET